MPIPTRAGADQNIGLMPVELGPGGYVEIIIGQSTT
jgi:hypothetical protein